MTPKVNASSKLYLLVFIMSAFIIGIGFYGIGKMKTMHQNTETLYADRVFPLKQLTSIRFSYSFGILSAAEQIQSSQLTFKDAKNKIKESEKNIADNWKAYMLTYLTAEEEQLTKPASTLMKQSTAFIEKLNAVLDKEDSQGLNNIINKELYPSTH